MANLNIKFNNKNYSIDPASLADALASLEAHLAAMVDEPGEPAMLAPGLYQPGAIALYEEGDYNAASAMMTASWDELEANGIIAISKGVEIPADWVQNEYGFYFGKPYSATINGETGRFIFNEDGSAVMKANGETMEIPAGTIIYGDHSIDMTAMNMPVFVVSDDGTQISGDGLVLSLEISNLPDMNEYGFYYGVFYSTNMEGVTVGFTFNEDGSVIISSGNETEEIPAGAVIYGDHSIDMSALDMPVLRVSPDGTMINLDGMILSVSENSGPPKGTVYLPNLNIHDPVSIIGGDLVLPNDGRATSLSMGAFRGQTSLTGIILPDNIVSMSIGAFLGCTSLASINIPNNVTSIGDEAFYNCSSLTSAVIPDSVTTIGNYAFSGCSGLTSVVIPDSVTTIGNSAFSYCSNLSSVMIPDSVTTIGNSAFSYCSNLSSVMIPDSVTTIGESAFYNCNSLTSVVIPDSVTTIGHYAFSNCSNLTSVVIPDSVAAIGAGAFSNCSNLTSVTIPDSVTTIGYSVFSGCFNLTSVVIPDSVTSIEKYAFSSCGSLKNIEFSGTTAQWNAISKGTSWNKNVPATYVQCSDGQVTL